MMWVYQYIPFIMFALLLVCYAIVLHRELKVKAKYTPYLLVSAIIIGIIALALILIYGN